MVADGENEDNQKVSSTHLIFQLMSITLDLHILQIFFKKDPIGIKNALEITRGKNKPIYRCQYKQTSVHINADSLMIAE